jgi:TPR repeat protein
MIRFWAALLLLSFSSSFAACRAAEADVPRRPGWVDPGWRRTICHYNVSFDAQGFSTTVFEFEIQALDERGAAAISLQSYPYNSHFTEVTASDLMTVKADGSVIAVDERAIRDQPVSTDIASPYLDEARLKIIAFSQVAAGDKIKGRLVYKSRKPTFAGAFARYWIQPADQPPEVIELTLDGPASKPLHVAVWNVEHSEQRRGDRIIHHVRFRQEAPQPRLIDADAFDDAKRFEVSTFADYAGFAAMLNARNAPMALPDEKLRKLSAEIVGDARDTRAKVERLHNWVARNIRYVGIGFEDGGWTSQPASAVLASRYGDCKAHATILKALLIAQGIESNFVAVNAGAQYTLTEVATPNFDHAIVYVPELDQYLDPTATLLAFGALPLSLSGKPALNVDKGILATIPVAQPERFTLTSDTDYTLAGDGTRRAHSVLSGAGVGALLGRAVAEGLERADRSNVARKRIEQANLSGSGDYSFQNPRELSDSYAIEANFEISKAIDRDRPTSVRMLALTDPRPSLSMLTAGGEDGKPFMCHALQYHETSSLAVPEGTNFYEKPAPVDYVASFKGNGPFGVASGRIEVKGKAVLDGRIMRADALVRLTFDAPVCPGEFAAAIKTGLDRLFEFNHGPISLTQGPAPYVTDIGTELNEAMAAFKAENYGLAMSRFKPLAEDGGARAQSYVAVMYEGGYGVQQDFHEAIRWYLMAAEQGDAYSEARLGFLYERDTAVHHDDRLAARWYEKAAEQGDVHSQANIATLYRDGRGVAQDFQQAARWYARAADQGYAWAQMNLGLLYAKGNGVPQDYAKAVAFFQSAADRKDDWAEYNLGWAYESGAGVAKDTQQAIQWYRKAADAGNPLARTRLQGLTDYHSIWQFVSRQFGSLIGR